MHTIIRSTAVSRRLRECLSKKLLTVVLTAITCRFGLVFFGTPHAGPSNDLMTKFGKACVAIAQSMPWNVSNDIMEALKKGSLFSDVLEDDWKHQLGKYHFVSFYEGIGSVGSHLGSSKFYTCRANTRY
jgi:hypothetical protein